MTAYVIADIQVTDPEHYEEYKQAVPQTIKEHGGKILARGGSIEVLEGHWKPGRVVIIEFESVEAAKEWWTSANYEGPKAIRHDSSKGSLVVIEGAPPA